MKTTNKMTVLIKIIFFVCLSVNYVNSMALEGPSLTRYDPCNLGVVQFDKIMNKFWQAKVNLALYKGLQYNVSIGVEFEKPTLLYGASQNTSVEVTNDKRKYWLRLKDIAPAQYYFFIKLEDNETLIPTVKQFSLNNYTLCDDSVKASETIESLNVTRHETNYMHICGRRALDNAEVTSFRTEAKSGDWPWHVAIFIKGLDGNYTYQCGGNVVSRTAIVTAGHCVSNAGFLVKPDRIKIIAGVSNYTDLNEVGRQEFIGTDVILHPSYDDIHTAADIAVINIQGLKYTEYVQPICIWGPIYDKTNLFGIEATMVGFGSTENDQQSEVLRSAYIMVQNDTTCINFDPALYGPLLNEFSFCAGYGPNHAINPRNGDSGGGIVIPTVQPDHKISWFLRGVLSKCGVPQGHKYCSPNYYVVFTDVGPHYGWIIHHAGLKFTNNIR